MTSRPAPSVIFMHSHNTGRFVQLFGHDVPTPNLQRLAREGVLFRKAFATAPTCSPSRASFLSGMFPHSCGMLGLAHRGFAMPDQGVHIVRTLARYDYRTALAGVEHTAPDPVSVGYEQTLSTSDINYPWLADTPEPVAAAVRFLTEAHDRPFFLSIELNATHRPFPPADPASHPAEDSRYRAPPPAVPDVPEIRADMALFKAGTREMDEAYGAVLAALDSSGLSENTLVCCFTDHALQFPRHMCDLLDSGSGVYLVLRGPGSFTGGRVVESLVSLMDLAPTVYDVAGIAPPPHVQGSLLLPLVSDAAVDIHDAVFAESNFHAAYEPMRCVRTARYKYIRRFDVRDRLVRPNSDDNVIKQFLLARGGDDLGRDQEMLCDFVFDPTEMNNRIDDAALAGVADDVRTRLDDWMRRTSDPLCAAGRLASPPNAMVNHPDDTRPNDPLILA